jgi:hypothetical protein
MKLRNRLHSKPVEIDRDGGEGWKMVALVQTYFCFHFMLTSSFQHELEARLAAGTRYARYTQQEERSS